MSGILRKLLQNKDILILGFGREGQTTYQTLRNLFPEMPLAIADQDASLTTVHPHLKTDRNLCLQLGPAYLDKLSNFDLIIKSPGISPQLFPYMPPLAHLSSQTELFIRAFRSQVIGVTGTKGKSTTASLIAHMLKAQYADVLLAGNIGIPPFGMLDRIGPETIIVYEMSSHQLEQIKVSPHIAVMLNIFQEHLDHYASYEAYQQVKMNICKFQEQGDWLVHITDNELLNNLIEHINPKSVRLAVSLNKHQNPSCWIADEAIIFSESGHDEKVLSLDSSFPLKGEHNFLNAMTAICVGKVCGLSNAEIRESMYSFAALEHRIEWVGRFQEIDFYNDSISTIPEATIAALKALVDVDTLILGGFDRGIDYHILSEALYQSTVRNIIFVGEAGERIKQSLLKSGTYKQKLFTATDYEKVVMIAMQETAKGKICLLSPAAASYDWFRNFEERGSIFKKLVKAYNS